MRNIQLLIDQSRRATENEEFSTTTGITDEEFIQYLNDGQDRLESSIQVRFRNFFQDESIISTVVGQESYDIPQDALLGTRIEYVEYSSTGQDKDYYALKLGNLIERKTGVFAEPSFYIRRSKTILLTGQPQTSGAKLRVTYQKKLARLDIRRATVSAVTLASSSITSLTLDTSVLLDDTALLEEGYVTVVNKYGAIQMKRIPVTAIDTSTGVVTIEPGFTFESGETIAVGDYLLRGPVSTTHSELPDICERYLLSYANWKIFRRDSSNDAIEQGQELQVLERDILDGFEEPEGDVPTVAVLDPQFITPNDFD